MIRFVEETGSTNADLASAIRGGEVPIERDWLVARRQTAGKGRQGREWFDGAGNFMGSTCVHLSHADPAPATLSFVSAISVFETARDFVGKANALALKWPNDVLLSGAKLSGILLEMVGQQVVVGIGVNLAKAPDLPDRATAALGDVNVVPAVEEFADSLAANFARNLADWRHKGLGATLQRFLGLSIHVPGSPLTVHDTDGSRIGGSFAGLDETDGALRLRLADGSERVIRAGDIS